MMFRRSGIHPFIYVLGAIMGVILGKAIQDGASLTIIMFGVLMTSLGLVFEYIRNRGEKDV